MNAGFGSRDSMRWDQPGAGPGGLRALTRWALAGLCCAVLVGVCIAFVDRPVADFVHATFHRPEWAKALTQLAVVPDPLAFLALLVIGVMYLMRRGNPRTRHIVLATALATILATMLVIVLKYCFGRLWPDTWVDNNPSWIVNHAYGFQFFHGGRGYESFPSGHTTRITAPFAVFWQLLPRYRVLWALPTLAVAAGLLICNFHFVSDCIAGAYLGAAAAAVIVTLLERRR
jgi:membrane-associated phospholipid phosphatase